MNRAVAKIKRYVDAEQYQRLEEEESLLEVVHPPANARLASKLAEIERAMTAQSALDLDYYAGYEGTYTKRRFDPYGIVNWKDKWYAVGFCHLRGEIRSFRVDRIGRIRRTDATFQRPASFSARQFLLVSLLPEPAAEPDDPRISVRIAGSPQALDDLCAHWLFGHALVERTANGAVFQLDERSLFVPKLLIICYLSEEKSVYSNRRNSGSASRTSPNRCIVIIRKMIRKSDENS